MSRAVDPGIRTRAQPKKDLKKDLEKRPGKKAGEKIPGIGAIGMARSRTPVVTRRASIGSRRNPDAEAAILAAARALLRDRGYQGFTVEEVARRAGAGKPTIYRWWPTKADLFIAVYGAEKAAAIAPPDKGGLVLDLTQFTSDLWHFWRTNPAGGAFRALIAEAQASPAALDALRSKFLPKRLEPLRAIFERAIARGEIRAHDVEDRVALWTGFNWFRLLTNQIEDDGRYIRRIMTLITR
jgi:AcrR family transcriptional regulator